MAQKKRNKVAEAAAMFAVTSMSSEELSALSGDKSTFVDDMLNKKEEAEIEKAHDEELAEAENLGIKDSVIIEATESEISKDFEKQLEESHMRYLEAIDDKKKLEKENTDLNKKITVLSSQIDVLKTDSSRAISNYKIEIVDLNEMINIYKANEINYKAEIAALKTDLANLENALNEANKIINKTREKPIRAQQNQSSRSIPMFMQKKEQPKKRPAPSNGYSSWN